MMRRCFALSIVAALVALAPTSARAFGDEHSEGVVKSVSASSMTINGSSGKATFTQTFIIDAKTKVVGKGVGTATAPKGGRAKITEIVSAGDTVAVWFTKGGDSLHASEVWLKARNQASSSSSK
ncbi:MAG TPA: hypothetical protein VFA59_00250 [Vicinamibacterales bacterium]|nr:hypothetical protein [Vicinamibacterales bacterium]